METVIPPTPSSQGYTNYVCNDYGYSYADNFTDKSDAVSGLKTTPSDVDVTLSWNSFEGAVEYYAKVYDKDFTRCIKTIATKGTSAVFDYTVLNYNTDYKFIVTAKISEGNYLTVSNATRVDGRMVIGSRVVGLKTTLLEKGAVVDFEPVANAEEYLVNVFENNAQGTRVYSAILSKDATSARVVNNLLAGRTYVVMINAKVNGKYIPLSDFRNQGFQTSFIAPVYYPPTVTIDDQTATSIRFSWDNVRGAAQYFVRVTEKETGKIVNTLNVVGKTTATLERWTDGTKISPNTTYLLQFYVYVDHITNSGSYGAPIEVTTIANEEVTVVARYNQNKNKINVSWNKTLNALGYFFYTYKNGVKISNRYIDGADNTIYEFTAPSDPGTYTYGVIAYEKNTSGTNYTPVSVSNAITK